MPTRPERSFSARTTAWGSTCATRTSFSGSFSGYTGPRTTKVPASAWRSSTGSLGDSEAGFGPRLNPTRARLFISPCESRVGGCRRQREAAARRSCLSHMLEPLRVLIVEDRPDDAELVAEHLRAAGLLAVWKRVDTEAAFAAELDTVPDLIIADYSLPQFSAPRALDVLKERGIDIPFIVVSGTIGEDAAVAAMRSGARDYVFKGNLSRLRPAVEREVIAAAERKAARVAEGDLVLRLGSTFDSALDAVVTMDADGVITDWNPMAQTIFGWPKTEAVGRLVAETVIPQRHREAHRLGLQRFLESGKGPVLNTRLEMEGLHRDGHEFPIELSIGATPSAHGYVFSAFARDISERRRAEEAVRRLAATVAASPDAIISADLNGAIISWNTGAERMYGYAAQDTIGRS